MQRTIAVIRCVLHYGMLCLALSVIVIASTSWSQHAPNIAWQRSYGGPDYDNLGSMVEMKYGGYLVVGGTFSNDSTVTSNHGLQDAWLVELDRNGSIQLQKCIGGTSWDGFNSVVATSDLGCIAAGYTASNDGDVVGHHMGRQHLQSVDYSDTLDAWVVKFDQSHKIQWQQCLGGSATDIATQVITTTDGGYAVCGYSTSSDESWLNHGSRSLIDEYDAFVVKLDSNGRIQWQHLYGGTNSDWAFSIAQTWDGGFVFSGETTSHDGDVSGLHDSINSGTGDLWVVRLSPNGALLWQRCYGGTSEDLGNKIVSASDGGFLVCGKTMSTDGDVINHYVSTPLHGLEDAWLLKLDSAGALEWDNCYGGNGQDWFDDVRLQKDGTILLGGLTSSTDGDVSSKHGGLDTTDAWILDVGTNGMILWEKTVGGTGYERDNCSFFQTRDNGYALCMSSNSNDGDVSANHGLDDIWFVKLDAASNSVESVLALTGRTDPFPNPASTQLNIELSQSLALKSVRFFNVVGTECFPNYRITDKVLSADIGTLPNGVFLIELSYPSSDGASVRSMVRSFVVSK